MGFQDEHVHGEEAVHTHRLTQKRGSRLGRSTLLTAPLAAWLGEHDAPGASYLAELLAKSPASAEWWVVSCGGAIIIIMIDRTIAITPSAMSLGDIASSKRSVDNLIQRVTGSLCSWHRIGWPWPLAVADNPGKSFRRARDKGSPRPEGTLSGTFCSPGRGGLCPSLMTKLELSGR